MTDNLHVTRQQLATIIGRSPDYVSRCIAAGLPTVSTGSGRGQKTILHLPTAWAWLTRQDGITLDQARTRLAVAQADKTELETAARRGEFVEVATVAREWADMGGRVKARLRAVPAAVADRAVAAAVGGSAAVHALLLDAIDGALRELAAEGRETPES